MEFLVHLVQNNNEVRRFVDDLECLKHVGGFNLSQLKRKVDKVDRNINTIASECEKNYPTDDPFPMLMGNVCENAKIWVNEVKKAIRKIDSDTKTLVKMFGENETKTSIEQLFDIFRKFLRLFIQAERAYNKRRSRENR